MTLPPQSVWDQVQLALLRRLTLVLIVLDHLLRVRWGERLLDRMVSRWQEQVAQINANLSHLESDRLRSQRQIDALLLQEIATELDQRSLACHELRFDPADPGDEKILDACVERLVKQRLAGIETQELEAGHYIYHLEPDWNAIRSLLARVAEEAEPEVAGWLREAVGFIDDSFLQDREEQ